MAFGKKLPKKARNSKPQSAAEPGEVTNKLDKVLISESPAQKVSFAAVLRRLHNKWIAAGVVVVLVFVVGGVVAFVRQKEEPVTTRDSYISSEGVSIRTLSKEDLSKRVEVLTYQKKFQSARELIEFQKEGTTKEYRMLLVTTFMNEGKHKEALDELLAIESQFGTDWKITRNIATQYERLKDKAKALVYYKKALEQLKATADVPVKDDEILFLNRDIKRVGG